MALVKVKPTSPGRRAVVKVVNPDLHKGKPFAPLVEKRISMPEEIAAVLLQFVIMVAVINKIIA
ncbi:50S ribosomal protein L2 [Methylophilaceae bacterium]|nr:50S ribosomal protein L2 [Methylophilaceae bacterium]